MIHRCENLLHTVPLDGVKFDVYGKFYLDGEPCIERIALHGSRIDLSDFLSSAVVKSINDWVELNHDEIISGRVDAERRRIARRCHYENLRDNLRNRSPAP